MSSNKQQIPLQTDCSRRLVRPFGNRRVIRRKILRNLTINPEENSKTYTSVIRYQKNPHNNTSSINNSNIIMYKNVT